MDILKYIGHEFQVYGVQKYVLDDGKGRGMRFQGSACAQPC